MARQKNGKRKREEAASGPRDGGRLAVLGKTAVLLVGLCGVGLGFYLGGKMVVRSVLRDRMFRVNPAAVRLALPACARDAVREEIALQLSYLSEMSVFEPRLPALVAQALQNSPWVLRVNRVERLLPNELSLQLEFRKPVGIVEAEGSLYLVDGEGYWLPSRLFRWPYGVKPPVIVGRQIDAWPQKGVAWKAPGIRAGAALSQFLCAHEKELPGVRIAKIDVTNYGQRRRAGKSCLVLETDAGTSVLWGCSPLCAEPGASCSPAGELTDEEKLVGLKRILKVRPGLKGCDVVDVRFRTPIILDKPPEEASQTPGAAAGRP